MSHPLTDRVIIITGASSGIGRATAIAAAHPKVGMFVALNARSEKPLRETAQQIGDRALAIPGDVTNPADMQNLVDQTLKKFGRLDAVYANAGYGLFTSVLDMTDADARAMIETNVLGTTHLIRAAMPALRQTTDSLKHILICSSAASRIGLPMYGHYSATKAAQHALADALRIELESENFNVTSIHPIGTKTNFFKNASKNNPNTTGLNTPDHMMQSPEHVAKRIIRALQKPKPQVWPSTLTRLGLALTVAFPPLGTYAMRKTMARQNKKYPPPTFPPHN